MACGLSYQFACFQEKISGLIIIILLLCYQLFIENVSLKLKEEGNVSDQILVLLNVSNVCVMDSSYEGADCN